MRRGERVWLVVCACSAVAALTAAAAAQRDRRACGPAHDFFRLANLSADEPPHQTPEGGPVCGGACCSARREAVLRARVRRDFSALAEHNGRALHALLTGTRQTIHDHAMELSNQSQNKTRMLFAQVYKSMAIHAHRSIEDLYADIRSYLHSNRSELSGAAAGATAGAAGVERAARDFFRSIFSLVYLKAAAKREWQDRDFTGEYKSCLREAYEEIEPFGDIPRQIAAALARGLEATRVLLEALALGGEVLSASDALLAEEWAAGGGGSCHAALLRMAYCGKCRGLPLQSKPCAGYCLNVVRGCVTWRVAELDAPWNAFVEGAQRLVSAERGADGRLATGDAALRPLDSRVSEAIMHAMENGINLEKKVKHACGHARLVEAAATGATGAAEEVAPAAGGAARRDVQRVAPPDTQITHFLASVDKSKGMFVNLADALCQDESFAEQSDAERCWNGEDIGEYTKTVVGPGASFQKYNPEVSPPAAAAAASSAASAADPRVAALADKLRHARQVLVSHVTRASPSAESFSYMQGDEAGGGGGGGGAGGGAEGSGSGRDDYADGDDDSYDAAEGSGEGSGAIETADPKPGSKVRTLEPTTTAQAPRGLPLPPLAVSAVSALLAICLPLLRWTLT